MSHLRNLYIRIYERMLLRSILHDQNIYGPTVNEFDPERFLNGKVPDPVAQFGNGRRYDFWKVSCHCETVPDLNCSICAGRHMADNSLWNSVSSMLHVFSISPAKDKDGKEIPVKRSFTSGLISYVSFLQVSRKLTDGLGGRCHSSALSSLDLPKPEV